jgi:hypothetical protein
MLLPPGYEMANILTGKVNGEYLVHSSLYIFPLGPSLPWPGYLGCSLLPSNNYGFCFDILSSFIIILDENATLIRKALRKA